MLRNKKLIYAGATALLLLVVFVPLPSLTQKGKGAVRDAMAPAERGVSGVWQRLSEATAAIRGIGGAVEKNRELRHELVRIQAELNHLRDAEENNARLRRAFKFRSINSYTMIPCDVISRNISGWWNSVRIGKGSADGIEANLAVISPDGLVGRTKEISKLTSEVLLVSDPACRVSARIARIKDGGYGLVRGAGSTLKGYPKARMEFINKDIEIKVGDEVVTSGLSSREGEGQFPKGVHIGYVDKVYMDKTGLFQHAELIPGATVGLLDYVFVVSNTGGEG
ncbi:Cell shape-determining protein MreC [Pontiella desulfatans]|uniref:Cell shape-determining protein MreC n=1 Tax=Pontiella desulfatans TaxID=2750659 RepID=A0A6C2UAQ0_PONDE|nr:rod shape-determining protein MreC [Pontiella desulfatans]VGO16933.1 Cell shape-determining protein MreC [Pontiella desulfatans]